MVTCTLIVGAIAVVCWTNTFSWQKLVALVQNLEFWQDIGFAPII
jgi:hypothetical protein